MPVIGITCGSGHRPANHTRAWWVVADLDRIDHEILNALSHNARLSNKELAAHVGLAPSTCLGRVRRLEADGVLLGYHAQVDLVAYGVGLQAMIAIRLAEHERSVFERLRDDLLARPEVLGVYHLAGADDCLVRVGVRDSDHLRDLVWEALAARAEVAHIETHLVFEYTGSQPQSLLSRST